MVKKFLWAVIITAVVITVILIALERYYIAVALLLGVFIIRHREIWSLLAKKRIPPADERVRENTGRAIRNGFIYIAVATAFLMLPFGSVVFEEFDTTHILAALFLSTGLVYMLSYLFYDRAEPKIPGRKLKILKAFLLLMGLSVCVFIISIFLHNSLSGLFDIEEPVFFIITVVITPLAFAVGLLGSLVFFIMGLVSRTA